MRHGIAGNRLGRNSSLRKATIRDVAKATLIRERICTTRAIAKEARKMVDRLITFGKKGSLAHKRHAFAILCDHSLVSDLFEKIAPRFRSRNGGYTRIIPLSNRRGDNARLAYLELTEKSEVVVSKPRTAGVSSQKSKTIDVPAIAVKESAEETTKEKPAAPKKAEPVKSSPKRGKPQEEKGKSGKKLMGGIKKMFQRKVGGE